jgi:tagaturonate reductase
MRKVRILNGLHSTVATAALLGGIETVRELVEDPLFGKAARRAATQEIVPVLSGDKDELHSYTQEVFQRFANPFIHHHVVSLLLNIFSKWKIRVLPTFVEHIATEKNIPPILSFSLAMLLVYLRGERQKDGTYRGRWGDKTYGIEDNPAVVEAIVSRMAPERFTDSPVDAVADILADRGMWGMNVAALHPDLAASVAGIIEDAQGADVRTSLTRRLDKREER